MDLLVQMVRIVKCNQKFYHKIANKLNAKLMLFNAVPNKTKGTLVPGREQLDMIYDSICLHCVVLDSIYLNFACLISFSLIESALIVSALIVSTLIVSTLIVSNLVVSALIMSALTFQQFKYLKKAY